MDLRLELKPNGCFHTYSIYQYEQLVGRFSLTEYSDRVHIESFLIFSNYRKKGLGKRCIQYLKSKYPVITGESSPFAINFWRKVGAEFDYEVNDEMIDYLMDIGEYPGFMIC